MSTSIQSLTPYLIVKNAREAIAFYGRAFGAEELFRLTDPHDGRIGHAELKLGENTVMIADEYPDFGALSPDTIGGSPVTFHLATLTVDANLARAVGAGAVVLRARRRCKKRPRQAQAATASPSARPHAPATGRSKWSFCRISAVPISH
ncbi:VOC family protein [Rhizobium mongolense]|uniref:VOC family protein n=1 Tax=Rhizobium mongolense TaxID=57676 RepID=UPI003F5FEDD7